MAVRAQVQEGEQRDEKRKKDGKRKNKTGFGPLSRLLKEMVFKTSFCFYGFKKGIFIVIKF